MFLILRRIKRKCFESGRFGNYLLYAVGEIFLVVIGILLALQIDNWNAGKQLDTSLRNYLGTIARNIEMDLVAVQAVQAQRIEVYEQSRRFQFTGERERYETDEVAHAYKAFEEARKVFNFNATTSGYESLKSSGVLDRLQGNDLEDVLFAYYDTVTEIARKEENHNTYLRQIWLEVLKQWPRDLDFWTFANPGAFPDFFDDLQPVLRQFFTRPSTTALHEHVRSVETLLLEYQRLDQLGQLLVEMTNKGEMSFNSSTRRTFENFYDPAQGRGYPDLITKGQVAWHSYYLGHTDSLLWEGRFGETVFNFRSFEPREESVHFRVFEATAWSLLFLSVNTSTESRPSLDYSMFDTLILEMKGDVGGEQVFVNLKDREDLDDGTQTNVALTLTNQWVTYKIDLAEFETADLSQLHTVLGLLFEGTAPSFSIRTARYE